VLWQVTASSTDTWGHTDQSRWYARYGMASMVQMLADGVCPSRPRGPLAPLCRVCSGRAPR
jgi:hypothetical protein